MASRRGSIAQLEPGGRGAGTRPRRRERGGEGKRYRANDFSISRHTPWGTPIHGAEAEAAGRVAARHPTGTGNPRPSGPTSSTSIRWGREAEEHPSDFDALWL